MEPCFLFLLLISNVLIAFVLLPSHRPIESANHLGRFESALGCSCEGLGVLETYQRPVPTLFSPECTRGLCKARNDNKNAVCFWRVMSYAS